MSRATPTLAELNQAGAKAFCQALAGVFEHAPWVVEAVAGQRPFASVDQLHGALTGVLEGLPADRLRAFFNLHPELAGAAARAGTMTTDSVREQDGLALGRLPPEQAAHWDLLNRRYRERFGFPFILCIRQHSLASALAAFETRLQGRPEGEMATALEEIRAISGLRLAERLTG